MKGGWPRQGGIGIGWCDVACEANGGENDCKDQPLGAQNPGMLTKILTPHPLQ